MALISVQDLSFSYEGSYEPVFSHVSFQIDSAWKLGLVGRNGKGKTTFLRILRGELEYTGTVASGMAFDYFPYEVADPFLTPPELAERYAPDVPGWKFRREAGLLQIRDDALKLLIETDSNPQQSWGDQRTQGAINVVPLK